MSLFTGMVFNPITEVNTGYNFVIFTPILITLTNVPKTSRTRINVRIRTLVLSHVILMYIYIYINISFPKTWF